MAHPVSRVGHAGLLRSSDDIERPVTVPIIIRPICRVNRRNGSAVDYFAVSRGTDRRWIDKRSIPAVSVLFAAGVHFGILSVKNQVFVSQVPVKESSAGDQGETQSKLQILNDR